MHSSPVQHALTSAENIALVQIDGLAFYHNTLVAHQGSTLGGIFRYFLNTSHNHVLSREGIEVHNLFFDYPTTGELAGDEYFFLANAQLRKFNQDGSIVGFEELDDVYILKTRLRTSASR